MFDLIRDELNETDRKVADTFAAFKRATPAMLFDTRPEDWPDLFPGRLAFEKWRERWLAYMVGLVDEPTDQEQYAQLRPRIWKLPITDGLDRFHS